MQKKKKQTNKHTKLLIKTTSLKDYLFEYSASIIIVYTAMLPFLPTYFETRNSVMKCRL